MYMWLHIFTDMYLHIYIFIHGSILDLGICPRNSEQSKNGLGLVMQTDWLQRGPFDLVWSEIPVLDLVGTPFFSQKRFLCDVHPTNHCWIDAVHITMRLFSGCKCKSKKDDEGLFVRWGFLASNSTDPGRSSNIGPICCRGWCWIDDWKSMEILYWWCTKYFQRNWGIPCSISIPISDTSRGTWFRNLAVGQNMTKCSLKYTRVLQSFF